MEEGKVHRVALFATHPIQYQVPWYRKLSEAPDIELTVIYGMLPSAEEQAVGFGGAFEWDIPLVDGYEWRVLKNKSRTPGLNNFFGIRCLGVGKVLSTIDADAVIVTGWHSFFLIQALMAAKFRRIPVLVRGDSNAMQKRSYWKTMLQRLLVRRYDFFLYVGEANKQLYLGHGISENRLFFVPHFIDNQRFVAESSDSNTREGFRLKCGIPIDSFCFIFAGKLEPKKRIMDLLEAFRILEEGVNGVSLLIVGDGEQRQQAEDFVKLHNLDVSFTGFVNQSEMPGVYGACDCLVLPSDYGETWGLVVNEAMVCGVPAIVSDRVGCGPDLVIESTTGFKHVFSDTAMLASRMLAALTNAPKSSKLGKKAREHVLTRYHVDVARDGTLRCLRSLP